MFCLCYKPLARDEQAVVSYLSLTIRIIFHQEPVQYLYPFLF
nr:MAG TPA: hypothetical protein [Caudoviricetes sp.]